MLMSHANSSCILCGNSRRAKLFRQEKWQVLRCLDCGLAVLDPRPDKAELAELYRQSYFADQYDSGFKIGSPELARRLSQEKHRLRFFRSFQRHGRLLDMGCGMGYFLLAAKNWGYAVEGLDISDDSSTYVRNELNIKVSTGMIGEIDYEESSFDVITMWHFLEHTSDPRECLEKASHWLKDGGLLVVDVPNYEGTDARLTWTDWTGWQLPYHFYHFTPKTLCALLARHGFTTLREKSYHSERVKERLKKAILTRPFARIIARYFSGHSYAVVARNNKGGKSKG
jgi:2-polyprenyl-3-methyl-5-hydroxy-6-metoxy-1,4-benzoquinol methylase